MWYNMKRNVFQGGGTVEHKHFTPRQKKALAWAGIAIFLLLTAAVGWFVGRPMLRFASQPEVFRQWVDGHGLLGMAAYVAMVFLQVLVAVIPGEPLEISGGYAFGALRGSLLCLLGAVLGSLLVFALVRRFGCRTISSPSWSLPGRCCCPARACCYTAASAAGTKRKKKHKAKQSASGQWPEALCFTSSPRGSGSRSGSNRRSPHG